MNSSAGQAIVEYILILVVVVAMALGVVYQFNDAFKEYARNYFGDYIACLLETGELPIIDNAPGDSGVCSQLFKPFSLADGKSLLGKGTTGTGGDKTPEKKDTGGGNTEASRRGGAGGSSGNFNGSSRFGRGGANGGAGSQAGKNSKSGDPTNTGSTVAGNYGGGYSATNRKLDTGVRYRVDNKFAFEDEREDKEVRRSASVTRSTAGDNGGVRRSKLRERIPLKDGQVQEDKALTFGSFLRFIIFAAIVIALVVFLGGQMLQVSKSME